jgi:hypothetical protein
MREITTTSHGIHAAILALTLLWAVPASAELTMADSRATAGAEATTEPNDKLAALSDSDALALAAKRKRSPAKIARTRPARLAALSHHDLTCSGSWCGRQFVLMIGIGF